MKVQLKPKSLLQQTSRLIIGNAQAREFAPISEPVWFKVVAAHPPTHVVQQKPHNLNSVVQEKLNTKVKSKIGDLYVTRHPERKRSGRTQHLYKPKSIQFFEDKIRKLFFQQHPWELARPKLLVENDGRDSSRQDWSSMIQKYKKLDGESVVQRTLYLMKNSADEQVRKRWLNAYDQARMEFYRLRMREETNMKVAFEEAQLFGSVFGPSYIDHGIEAEQKVIDKWKIDAAEATSLKRARFSSPSIVEDEPEVEADAVAEPENL